MSSIAGYGFESRINPVTPTRNVVVSHPVVYLIINCFCHDTTDTDVS